MSSSGHTHTQSLQILGPRKREVYRRLEIYVSPRRYLAVRYVYLMKLQPYLPIKQPFFNFFKIPKATPQFRVSSIRHWTYMLKEVFKY